MTTFREKLQSLFANHEKLIQKPNSIDPMWSNGVFERYRNPVVTANHVPVEWRYDLDEKSNPGLLERLGMNAALNPGAILFAGKPTLVVRFEGADRKSFFAVAQSDSPTEGFRCWDEPVDLPEAGDPDINVYDMRLTAHEDGWIYGLFCTERRDPSAPDWDLSAAVANCGIVRTKDLRRWERLPDLQSNAAQQRNVVLHPEFVDGKYALYTRPADLFMEAGKGRGIGWALCPDITHPVIGEEIVIDPRAYHTVKEAKNGQGPPPLKTSSGWLHLAHGVRNTAAGMRYVLYLFLTDLAEPWRVIARPGGHFMAPIGSERVGDVSNVLFCNGWIPFPDGRVAIYYASSDTRIHVAMSSIDCLLDYVRNTPEDGLKTRASLETRLSLLRRNRDLQRSADFQKDL